MIVYHGTTLSAARRIVLQGFHPRAPSRRVWFAQSRSYAQQRARSKAQRAHDRAIVLTCDVDLGGLQHSLGAGRVMHRGGLLAVAGPVSREVLRSHPSLGIAASPAELAAWVCQVLGVKPHRGPGRGHPGILRLSRWVSNRMAANPRGDIAQQELLALARQWLPEHFAGLQVDFEHLCTLPVAIPPSAATRETGDDEPARAARLEARVERVTACLDAHKPERRCRGLQLLLELGEPELFDWCVMFLDDADTAVRVQALKVMRACPEIELALVEPLSTCEDRTVRAAALEVLLQHDAARADQWLWLGLTDPEPHVRLTAVRYLGRLDAGAHPEVRQAALWDPHPEVARRARLLDAGGRATVGSRPAMPGRIPVP